MKDIINKGVILLTLAFLLGSTICFLFTFMNAFFSETKTVLVDINHFDEATLELRFVILFSIISVFGVRLILLNTLHRGKKENRN